MKRRMQTRSRGFTLLEVVVSVALFALLMSIVYSGFTTAVRAYDAVERRIDEVERMRVVSAFIRRSVGGAHALAIAVDREWDLQFDGTPEQLRYIADLPGYVGAGGLHELVLELETNGEHQDLVMRRRPLVIDRSGELQGELETRVLADNVTGFALRFYGVLDDQEVPAWHDEWSSTKLMPLLVELTISPENGPIWPLLQVRPHVDAVRYVNASSGNSGEPSPPQAEEAPEESRDPTSAAIPVSDGTAQNPSAPAPAIQ